MKRENILGFPVDGLTMEEALLWIKDQIKKKDSKIIAVTNANKLWQAHRDERIASFIENADLIIPEYALVWGARQLGINLVYFGGGVTLFKEFLPFAQKEKIRPYFLGAKPQIIEKMIQVIRAKYQCMDIAGYHHGYFMGNKDKELVLADIHAKKPDIIFVAMGSPKQEMLLSELKKYNNVPVMMGVGGSFDVVAGAKKDTPSWARARGVEWLYRISQDPTNFDYWKRYMVTNAWFLLKIIKAKYLLM